MIDTKIKSNCGFDPDATVNLPNHLKSYEVIFESPININIIVGYFDRHNNNNTSFYLNDEYTGNFSWEVENVVENYNQQIQPKIQQSREIKLENKCECIIL